VVAHLVHQRIQHGGGPFGSDSVFPSLQFLSSTSCTSENSAWWGSLWARQCIPFPAVFNIVAHMMITNPQMTPSMACQTMNILQPKKRLITYHSLICSLIYWPKQKNSVNRRHNTLTFAKKSFSLMCSGKTPPLMRTCNTIPYLKSQRIFAKGQTVMLKANSNVEI
jgi:hypothetical protein